MTRDRKDIFSTNYKLGQNNVQVLGMDIHNPVFFISSVLILVFVIGTLIYPSAANETLGNAKSWAISNFDWLFMLGGNVFVLFCLALILLPAGKVRLGGLDATPDFTLLSWFSMLFAAGMGIGLMFWSVAEPVAYYTAWHGTPLNVEPRTQEGMQMAMGAAMYHWGLHPWAIFGIVGLALSFFAYNKGLPLTIRSTFFPLLGEKVWGKTGDLIDILAVLATIFGLATSLGLGAQQAASGLIFLFDMEGGLNVQIGIIIGVTAVALMSIVRGIDGGVKVLSNINMLIALVLLLFILFFGPTLAILSTVGITASNYIENIIPLSNWIGREDESWLHGWTVFYWAWWISWSPFVGMFIARISRGRTVREFIIAVLLVPTIITLIWMASFGGSALEQIQNNVGQLSNGIGEVSLAMFQMLENLPLTTITSLFAIILVLVFFTTSSDSGSLVIDSITAGGKVNAPIPQRIYWAVMQGTIAGVLLYVGGSEALKALQAGAITTGLPFTLVLLVMCVSLYKGLHHEYVLFYRNN